MADRQERKRTAKTQTDLARMLNPPVSRRTVQTYCSRPDWPFGRDGDYDVDQVQSWRDRALRRLPTNRPMQRASEDEVRQDVCDGVVALDDAGRPRAAFGMPRGQEPGFCLYDRAGVARAWLALSEAGAPELAFAGADGQVRVSVSVDEDGAPFVALRNSTGSRQIRLGFMDDLAPVVAFYAGKAELPRLVLGLDGKGEPLHVECPGDGAVQRTTEKT